jgi:integrase
MNDTPLLDAAGRLRSPATMPGFHRGRPPRNRGLRYPADPPPVEEVVAVMRVAGESAYGLRTRALIVVLWRAGLRISEALALAESDLDRDRGAILVRRGKGGKRREVGMDRWAWEQIDPWLRLRISLRVGALLCVVHGPTQGRPWSAAGVRETLRQLAVRAGVRRRFAPHQLRHAHAVEMAREGVPLNVIQRQLGHANLGITSIYLQGIDNSEIIDHHSCQGSPDAASERGSALTVVAQSGSANPSATGPTFTPNFRRLLRYPPSRSRLEPGLPLPRPSDQRATSPPRRLFQRARRAAATAQARYQIRPCR